MVEAEQFGRLLAAVGAEVARTAGAPGTLVSVTFDWIAAPENGEATAPAIEVTRATRTLVFTRSELRGAGGRLVAAANAVHRI